MGKQRSTPPKAANRPAEINAPPAPPDPNQQTPRFCLRHSQTGFDVDKLSKDQRADFAVALHKRARMTWREIILADKHGLGLETMPRKSIKPKVPAQFEDTEKFHVLRYSGKLPMVGVRLLDTFHIIWIEAAFGDVYDHGG